MCKKDNHEPVAQSTPLRLEASKLEWSASDAGASCAAAEAESERTGNAPDPRGKSSVSIASIADAPPTPPMLLVSDTSDDVLEGSG